MQTRVQFTVQTTADPVRAPRMAPGTQAFPREASRLPFLEEWLIGLALLATLGVVCGATYFPYHDATNNLARYVLMDRAWFGTPAPFVQVRFIPTPYIALDVLGVMLVHLVGPTLGLRAMACLLVVVIPAGMYALLRATCPQRRGWALVGVLCSLSFYLLIGFFNFVAGIGVALFWLAAWWPRRDATQWRTRLPLLLALAGVFLVHLAGAMAVLVVLGVAYLMGLKGRVTGDGLRVTGTAPAVRAAPVHRTRRFRALFDTRFTMLVACTVVVGVMYLIWYASLGSEPPLAHVPPDFRPIPNKLANLASPFYSFSYPQMALMGAGYVASLAAFIGVNRRTLRLDAMLVSAAAFVFLFLVFPYRVDGAGFVDMRWLLPALVLPFCATATGPVPPQRAWLAVPCVATLLHLGLVRHETQQLDADLRTYRAVIDAVPSGARLLPIVADRERYGRLDPFRHFALWHTIDARGRVPGLLAEEDRYSTNPPALTHKFFGHFREPVVSYYPDERWGAQVPFPLDSLDWQRIDADYDYVIVAGADTAARLAVAPHAELVTERHLVALYRVHAAIGGRAPTPFESRDAGPMRETGIMQFASYYSSGVTGRGTTTATTPTGDAMRRPDRSGDRAHSAGPGGFYTPAQIAFVTGKIQSHEQPWADAYDQLRASVGRVRNREPHAMAVYNVPGYYQDQKGFFAATGGITGDADAAYVLALAYRLGDGPQDADAAQRLLNAWAHTNTGVTGYDGQLSMAEVGVGFIIAAELLSNYPGWAQTDQQAFKQWVRSVYLAQAVNPIKDRKNNWGDWGSFGAVTADDYLGDAAGVSDETVRLERHIDSSIAPDGQMPEEIARGAGGIWYTYFALDPLTAALNVVRNSGGPNLFDPSTPRGARVQKALSYLFNALQNPSAWPYGANPKVPGPRETWGYDLFEAMSGEYGNSQWDAYAATRRPIMNPGHHYAWTFPTLMKAPSGGT
jgi:hypothetical protein